MNFAFDEDQKSLADTVARMLADHHALLSPELADRMVSAGVDKAYRGREKASDHAPTWVELTD